MARNDRLRISTTTIGRQGFTTASAAMRCSSGMLSDEASSIDKYDAMCGWASFKAAKGEVTRHADHSHGMQRVETKCAGVRDERRVVWSSPGACVR